MSRSTRDITVGRVSAETSPKYSSPLAATTLRIRIEGNECDVLRNRFSALMPRRPSGPPTRSEVRKVARIASKIIENDLGYTCCLFGSAATSLWGTTKSPNDVDIVVMYEPEDEEDEWFEQDEIKNVLKNEDDRFITVPSRFRSRNHTVLWFCLPGYQTNGRALKVDILFPGKLNIPEIYPRNITRVDDIPIMPILPLLFLKVQGWHVHRTSPRPDFKAKEEGDTRDVEELLRLAYEAGKRVHDSAGRWLVSDFSSSTAKGLANKFLSVVPSSIEACPKSLVPDYMLTAVFTSPAFPYLSPSLRYRLGLVSRLSRPVVYMLPTITVPIVLAGFSSLAVLGMYGCVLEGGGTLLSLPVQGQADTADTTRASRTYPRSRIYLMRIKRQPVQEITQ
ncbi:hypothetical protein EW146_g3531 [Bondarzewia mesenterica]|uniref:Uncharacterized protein n=1 Tax=Bondarzewia mesenterica TaxID=1095465 RepID=A0A4S4LZ38_9AGAM|nr:hypothetical protein EW146_g3531 [Bondarzewia mesenterica]